MSSSQAANSQSSRELRQVPFALESDRVASRWSRKVAIDIVTFLDVMAVVLGAFFPVWIYYVFGNVAPNIFLTIQSSLVAAVIVVVLMKMWGMYDTNEIHNLPERPACIFGSVLVAFVAVLGLGIPYIIDHAQLWVWYVTWGCATYTMLLANRDISRIVLKKLTAAGRFDTRVAVFGAGKIARRVHDQLANPALGVTFVGVFDDRFDDGRVDPDGLEVRGGLDDLIAWSRAEQVDKIVVALPQVADERMAWITRQLEKLPVSVHIVTHMASDLVEHGITHTVSNIGDVGLLDVKRKALCDWSPIIKRVEDLVVGSIALFFVAMIAPFIAIAIYLEDGGPILFRQRRRGLNMREFDVLKFRTMTCDDEVSSVEQAKKNDPRVTWIGKFLRRFSLDELPQILNVMHGDMSLVGPRPHAVAHDDEFGTALEQYANRHQVKPGITGLAQVNGARGETSTLDKLEERVSYDIEYIKTWSLWLDLQILSRTIWAVLAGQNAY